MSTNPSPAVTSMEVQRHVVQIEVVIHNLPTLLRDGQQLFLHNGGDHRSRRGISEHIVECLMFGDSPADHGFQIEAIR